MPPRRAAALAAAMVIACASVAEAQGAQQRDWNSPAALDLIARAIARRTAQLADSGLADYKATAHGYVTFLAQMGEGFRDPPQVVRADELAVEVYWRAPNQSKQRVVGRRFDVVKPTDIAYHSDHLAVVQNNFPAIIRLGDGDEVRDVPHPLSLAGRDDYDFAIADSLRIQVAGRAWDVVTVEFRPRDERLPRAVGAVYLDRETATVVRLGIAFTRAALIDPALEDVSVVLDNGLVEGRFWLPRRQDITIRRTGTWLDFPVRGIIHGTWDICCVEVNRDPSPALFAGPEITFAPPAELAAYPFTGLISDSIPALASAAFDEPAAAAVRARATALVGAAALRSAQRWRLAGASVSDFARVNRVEGLALGGRTVGLIGARVAVDLGARYGLDDRVVKYDAGVSLAGGGVSMIGASVFDTFRDLGLVPEASRFGNSIAAQEFGSDVTDEYRASGVRAFVQGGSATRWRFAVERSRETPLAVHARPSSGAFRAAAPATRLVATSLGAGADGRAAVAGFTGSWLSEARVVIPVAGDAPGQEGHETLIPGPSSGERVMPPFARIFAAGRVEGDAGAGKLALAVVLAAAAGPSLPTQAMPSLGGPVTGPGYEAHSLRGREAGALRMEWAVPVAGLAVPLGRFGAPRVEVKAVPFAAAAYASALGWRRSVGMGFVTLYDALRLDVVRGVDAGGRWELRLDFGRAFWPVL
ncbi:MAG: hypothetical protein IT356_08090 [Gemmatimonadaceae bacterium]|nr:hypothetical protein [Gemmatimonadaceae bacterium]